MKKPVVIRGIHGLPVCKDIVAVKNPDKVFFIRDYFDSFDNDDGWVAGYVQCDLCNHKWAAVYPTKLNRIECPNCSNMVTFEKL